MDLGTVCMSECSRCFHMPKPLQVTPFPWPIHLFSLHQETSQSSFKSSSNMSLSLKIYVVLAHCSYQNKSKSLKEEGRVGGQGKREKKREGEGKKERGSCSKCKSLNAQINDVYVAEMVFGKTEIQCHGNEHNVAELDSSTTASSTCQGGKLDFGARQSVGVESRI